MSDDAMVPIAVILGRGEALTVAAMLDAAGIIVHTGGKHYASATPHIIAMGGFRLTVPQWQHEDASAVVRAMLAEPEPPVGTHMRRAIVRLWLAIMVLPALMIVPFAIYHDEEVLYAFLASSLAMLGVPVSPQCRGDYFLSAPDG
jgi:hypothetical protein